CIVMGAIPAAITQVDGRAAGKFTARDLQLEGKTGFKQSEAEMEGRGEAVASFDKATCFPCGRLQPLERRAGQFAGWMFRTTTTRTIKAPGTRQRLRGIASKRASGGGFSRFLLLAGGEGESQWQPSDVRSFPSIKFGRRAGFRWNGQPWRDVGRMWQGYREIALPIPDTWRRRRSTPSLWRVPTRHAGLIRALRDPS